MSASRSLIVLTLLAMASAAGAAPSTYTVDPRHTYPSFQADHGGMSYWRGKFNKTSGSIDFDKASGTGSVEISIDTASVDVGFDELNTHLVSADFLDVAKFPTATYRGTLAKVENGMPTEVQGELTLHGVTKPLTLRINLFKCQLNREKKESCGADASGSFNREDFGVSFGKTFGFKMDVTLQIQVEASVK